MDAKDKRYQYNRFGMKGARVGQAVVDIMSKDQPETKVEDILQESAGEFLEQFEVCVEEGSKKYTSPFYVFVLTGKEMWAVNMMRNWFIARQTPPYALDMMCEHPNKTKSLYLVDYKSGRAKLVWTIPSLTECPSILGHENLYHPDLVRWIQECFAGKLDKDSYEF